MPRGAFVLKIKREYVTRKAPEKFRDFRETGARCHRSGTRTRDIVCRPQHCAKLSPSIPYVGQEFKITVELFASTFVDTMLGFVDGCGMTKNSC